MCSTPPPSCLDFGGDAMRHAEWTVKLPIYVNGRSGLVECFVVDGSTPMLVGRPILKALKIKVDWENDWYSFDNGPWQPATLGQKGEFLIKFDDGVTADPEGKEVQFDLVTAETFDLVTDHSQGHSNGYTLQQYLDATSRDPPELAFHVADDENHKAESNVTTSDLFDPDDEQETLVRRNITEKLMKGMRFHHAQQLAHRHQVLEHGLRAHEAGQKIFWEVYSGCGLLSQEMARRGYKVFSFDYNTGWDFDKPSHRNEYFKLLDEVAPDFVWIAPSCKKWSHMQNINLKTEQQRFALQCERDYNEAVHLKLSRRTYDTQHREGRDSGIEHPKLSEAWNTKTWHDLPGYACHLDQCAFDAMIADYYIKKPTRLQLTNQQMAEDLAWTCPGDHQHLQLEGSLPGIGSLTQAAAAYQETFCWYIGEAIDRLYKMKKEEREMKLEENNSDYTPTEPPEPQEHDALTSPHAVQPPPKYQCLRFLVLYASMSEYKQTPCG